MNTTDAPAVEKMNMVAQAERRVRTRSWRKNAEELVAQAASTLRRNDAGGWTRAAPGECPG
jgi:hypothetical protein